MVSYLSGFNLITEELVFSIFTTEYSRESDFCIIIDVGGWQLVGVALYWRDSV
jgi:hypothetical protein